MSGSQRTFDLLMRAIASATSTLELADIRALAASHHHHRLDALDEAITRRRRELEADATPNE